MARYLFSSHDGFGLGHVRRNTLLAQAILADDPDASVVLVTGVGTRPPWLCDPRIKVVRVPPLLKESDGQYRSSGMRFEDAVSLRAAVFSAVVDRFVPDAVIVDRHPFGTAGELEEGLRSARSQGARLFLGLRDVIDEPKRVAAELAGDDWQNVADVFDDVLVYGDRSLCDHEEEYGLAVEPIYCGWVTETLPPEPVISNLLVVAAGGGGDGEATFRLGLELLRQRPEWRGVLVAGIYGEPWLRTASSSDRSLEGRVEICRNGAACGPLFASAAAIVQMAGYNSTYEALASGRRPILVPRRSPRREQAIRASRLAAMGLVDVVDQGADAAEVAWLLDRPRLLPPGALDRAGIRLDGAERAAAHIRDTALVHA